MFDSKIAIVVRDDLATWQKLNVTAFPTSRVIAENPDIVGAPYEDASGKTYGRLSIQPIIVLAADGAKLHPWALSGRSASGRPARPACRRRCCGGLCRPGRGWRRT